MLQPPRIRHPVLEASAGLEVIEIGCPALLETHADHGMALPTGQVFLRHVAAEAPWRSLDDASFEGQTTAMALETQGLADVRVMRPAGGMRLDVSVHDRELLFGFIQEGSAVLSRYGDHALGPADAFVIPASEAWGLCQCLRFAWAEARRFQMQ